MERRETPWKRLTPAEQDELLTDASTTKAGAADATIRNYFDDLRGWITGAYYSSEIGMRELGWKGQATFDALPGCEHPAGHHLNDLSRTSKISALHFPQQEIGRADGERHDRERRVLTSARHEAGGIHHEEVPDVMRLLKLVQH